MRYDNFDDIQKKKIKKMFNSDDEESISLFLEYILLQKDLIKAQTNQNLTEYKKIKNNIQELEDKHPELKEL